MLLWTSILLAFTTLLPLVNPLGTALVFAGLVGDQPLSEYRFLARRIALATFLFLTGSEYLGTVLLHFFGLSMPIVQAVGGLVLASNGWRLLFQSDGAAQARTDHSETLANAGDAALREQVFYPFTFPLTAGPGCFVAMLTLSSRSSQNSLAARALMHGGTALAVALLCGMVALCYGYAPRLIHTVSPGTAHGIVRIMSFLLLCIGAQIAWRGLLALSAAGHPL